MKGYQIRSHILILLTILSFQGTLLLEVNIQLPPLKQYNYSLKESEPVNVTVGENFAIGISQFDIEKVPSDLKVYQITQEKFINMFETMEKHKKKNFSLSDRKKVDADIFSCRIKNPSMQITKTINVFNQRPTNKFSFSSQQNIIYVPIRRHQLLYVLDTNLLQIQVYHYTPQKLNFLSSAQLGISANSQKITMGSSSSEELVYIFTSMGIWSIQTKTVLTNIQYLEKGLGNFDSKNYQVDRLYQGPYNFLFGLKRLSQIYIIPQKFESNLTFSILRKFRQTNITPQDIFIYQSFLYVLDLHHGIFVYQILGDASIAEHDHISWTSYGNIEITVHQSSVFVRYLDQQGQKIVELNYNSQTHKADLVRYIKSDQSITNMMVQKVPVSLSQHLYSLSESYLFLAYDNGQVQIYPFNVDPRQINSAHNGVKIHIENVVKVLHLFEDIYIAITYEKLIYAKIRIEKPELQCKMKQSTGHIYYEIQFSSNVSTCESFDPTFQHKSFYSTSCMLTSNYIIYVDDPDLSRFQKALLYGCVFIVVASFIVGLLCLIQWRNNKLSLIGRIKDEILKLRDRYRKMQPFTQEQPDNKNQIEFELPEAPPLPDN